MSATKPAPETAAESTSAERTGSSGAERRAAAESKTVARADAGDAGAPAVEELKRALDPLCADAKGNGNPAVGDGKGAGSLKLLKDLIIACDDRHVLEEIQECVRLRLNTLAKEQNRIKLRTLEVRRIDRFTYRLKETKAGSPPNWYIHYTERGHAGRKSRTVTRYLGKKPTFNPEIDLQKSRKRGPASTPSHSVRPLRRTA